MNEIFEILKLIKSVGKVKESNLLTKMLRRCITTFISSMFRALIMCIIFFEKNNKCSRVYECSFFKMVGM